MKLPKVSIKTDFWEEEKTFIWKGRYFKTSMLFFYVFLGNGLFFLWKFPFGWFMLVLNVMGVLMSYLIMMSYGRYSKKGYSNVKR